MRLPRLRWLLLAPLLLATACLTVGRNFPIEALGTLRIGASDRKAVQAALGDASAYGRKHSRIEVVETWTYFYGRSGSGGTFRMLEVQFDRSGVMVGYEVTDDSGEKIPQPSVAEAAPASRPAAP